jgi:hypothetical protein
VKNKHILKKNASENMARVRSNHPLVGTWEQERNPYDTTTVRFTIAVEEGCFVVSGLDEADGEALKITSTRWDGEDLRFISLCPSTNHKAKHVLRILERGRMSHEVSYDGEEGRYSDRELWRKSNQKSNL